ncbi:hypothetical protein [Photobacterium lipolyticum]|uniref:Uncharacterized protein n=1 Tax=Photobacterium lipolyticum TaxID=266810 RepID=A0A2T3MZC9_9GAMM|nr:hypothetical protein [Photobacterium lipolyticum]PSW05337.1 hypothetical protein C9I89_08730 [Photobacterium lipolyticum]
MKQTSQSLSQTISSLKHHTSQMPSELERASQQIGLIQEELNCALVALENNDNVLVKKALLSAIYEIDSNIQRPSQLKFEPCEPALAG